MKRKKILSLFLAALAVSSTFSSCNNENNEASSSSSNESAAVEKTEYTLIEDKTSDYVIVVPEECVGSEMAAAETLQMYLYSATSCKLDIVTEIH